MSLSGLERTQPGRPLPPSPKNTRDAYIPPPIGPVSIWHRLARRVRDAITNQTGSTGPR